MHTLQRQPQQRQRGGNPLGAVGAVGAARQKGVRVWSHEVRFR
jgi:hypothetical protein